MVKCSYKSGELIIRSTFWIKELIRSLELLFKTYYMQLEEFIVAVVSIYITPNRIKSTNKNKLIKIKELISKF